MDLKSKPLSDGLMSMLLEWHTHEKYSAAASRLEMGRG
jgi:hypothetical protein